MGAELIAEAARQASEAGCEWLHAGVGKTDAKDAFVIPDQARMRTTSR
ncbi:hypothetical protein [Kitasatospora sp. GAS204A]